MHDGESRLKEPAERYREFAERVIGRLHGMDVPEVSLGELTPHLAREIPVPDSATVVGAVSYRRDGKLLRADAYIDVPGELREVLAFYDERLRSSGWKLAPPQPPGMHGGFVGMIPGLGSTRTFVRGKNGPFIAISVKTGRERVLDVAAHWDAGAEGGHPGALVMHGGRPMAGERIPPLLPPDGTEVRSAGGGGSDDEWRTEAEAISAEAPAELEAHYARQLAEAGWNRLDGGSDGPLSWSRWRLPADGFEGLLLVLRLPLRSKYLLSLRLESTRSAPRTWGFAPFRTLGP